MVLTKPIFVCLPSEERWWEKWQISALYFKDPQKYDGDDGDNDGGDDDDDGDGDNDGGDDDGDGGGADKNVGPWLTGERGQ